MYTNNGSFSQYISVPHVAAEVCDVVEQVNAAEPESLARLEPLREFTLPRRDPRYDAALER